MTTEAQKIIEVARGYLGQQEVAGNMGFKDPAFEEEMRSVGWQQSWAWCSLFAALVWRKVYAGVNSYIENDLRVLQSPSATATYNNFKASPDYKQYVSNKPEVGSLVIFRQGSGWQGHVGIVESIKGKEIVCIEGNSNSKGGREGVEVARLRRIVTFDFRGENNLNLLGFIHPPKADNHPK